MAMGKCGSHDSWEPLL